ncbi:hypothetical protein GCK72_023037 [Caenorhabditis remanei]|uniref:Uncharacterized protein n=1 Tax=Caenorhabditis remanei TaxID=31234 RepID=A0A6A5FVC0_CAERE|nr:hypothetical protein GCK72_023037 [Caenorhabditis remanei]KAF1746580.1 hypothetical protein GCK72_023037 [Caenorhabditis remanei]
MSGSETDSEMESKYYHTRWNRIREADMVFAQDTKFPNSTTTWVARCDSTALVSSRHVVPANALNGLLFQYYLMDSNDLIGIELYKQQVAKPTLLKDLVIQVSYLPKFTQLMKTLAKRKKKKASKGKKTIGVTEKKFYIRAIPPIYVGRTKVGETRVFADEIATILPLLSEQQGDPLDISDLHYRHIYETCSMASEKCNVPESLNTMTLKELKELLEEYDINKSLITLVDDPLFIIGYKSVVETIGHFKLLSCNSCYIISGEQATWYMFQSLICGVNWEDATFEQKEEIIKEINEYVCAEETFYHSYSRVVKRILQLKTKHSGIYKNNVKPFDFFLRGEDPNRIVPYHYYETIANSYKLPLYKVSTNEKLPQPAWKIRLYLLLGFMHTFVNYDHRLLEFIWWQINVVYRVIMILVPSDRRLEVIDMIKIALVCMKNPAYYPEEVQQIEGQQQKSLKDVLQQDVQGTDNTDDELSDLFKNYTITEVEVCTGIDDVDKPSESQEPKDHKFIIK